MGRRWNAALPQRDQGRNIKRTGEDDGVGSWSGMTEHQALEPAAVQLQELAGSERFGQNNRIVGQAQFERGAGVSVNLSQELKANILKIEHSLPQERAGRGG